MVVVAGGCALGGVEGSECVCVRVCGLMHARMLAVCRINRHTRRYIVSEPSHYSLRTRTHTHVPGVGVAASGGRGGRRGGGRRDDVGHGAGEAPRGDGDAAVCFILSGIYVVVGGHINRNYIYVG